jgi:hypothetical protein
VPAVLGFIGIWNLEGDLRDDLPPVLLASCWLLLIATMILCRHRTEREIGTLKVGSYLLLAIGGLGFVLLNIR